ncbi:MAG TPA: hypothetical protein VIC07_08650 [Acidimicrobiia bacterium]|jgi:hypothetical protein
MRRLLSFVAVLVILPVTPALAADLGELLDESRQASYTAEQVISCSTPDGARTAVVEIEQAGGSIHVSGEVEVSSGYGGWESVQGDSVVTRALVKAAETTVEPMYSLDDGTAHPFLNRKAGLYRLYEGDVLRGELVVDGATGAMLGVTTYNGDGTVYCERRFIEFDPTPPESPPSTLPPTGAIEPTDSESALPEVLGDFKRLDIYQDDDGVVFAYYSDGFFSFAVFETRAVVTLDDGASVTFGRGSYVRSFTPGQAIYVWQTGSGGMALVGDLPPDMHEDVLAGLPTPTDPGLLQRLWRSLFG